MAAPYNPPVKNEDFIIYVALEDYADPGNFKIDPTIAAGDFKVSIDGAALANLSTLPAVTPAGSRLLKITLSSAEMNGDVIAIQGVDQTDPKEWSDFMLAIPTTA